MPSLPSFRAFVTFLCGVWTPFSSSSGLRTNRYPRRRVLSAKLVKHLTRRSLNVRIYRLLGELTKNGARRSWAVRQIIAAVREAVPVRVATT